MKQTDIHCDYLGDEKKEDELLDQYSIEIASMPANQSVILTAEELLRWQELAGKAHLIIMNYLDTYAPEPLGEIMDNLGIERFGTLALPGGRGTFLNVMQRLEELLGRFYRNTDPAILSQVDPS